MLSKRTNAIVSIQALVVIGAVPAFILMIGILLTGFMLAYNLAELMGTILFAIIVVYLVVYALIRTQMSEYCKHIPKKK